MKRLNYLILLSVILLLIIGCAEEATTPSNGKNNQQEPDTKGLTAFVEGDNDTRTRTTAEYFDNGGTNRGLHYYWTEGDRLWVNNGGTLIQDASNNISLKLENNPSDPTAIKRAATAKFYFNGTFTADSYPLRYTGKDNPVGDKVTIKAEQTQVVPNDASHIATDGDCGTAIATKPTGDSRYFFTISHKAAYATFLPYTTQGIISGTKIQKIRVWCPDQAISGQFNFNESGIDVSSRPVTTEANQQIELAVNDFSLPAVPTFSANAATMVIAPGVYNKFYVEYTLYDPVTNIVGTITKAYNNIKFTAGQNKRISQDLQITVYPSNSYYMWDAVVGQHYWAGYEGDQPTTEGGFNGNYPQNSSDPRLCNQILPYDDPTGTAPAVAASRSSANCPNANEVIWYGEKGSPHSDTRLWALMGHLYTGGIWLKKQSVIAHDNSKSVAQLKAAAPNGIDYTRTITTYHFSDTNIEYGVPSNIDDYFFLPALGYYLAGNFYSPGGSTIYWSSTPYRFLVPISGDLAYGLGIYRDQIKVDYFFRNTGFINWTAQ